MHLPESIRHTIKTLENANQNPHEVIDSTFKNLIRVGPTGRKPTNWFDLAPAPDLGKKMANDLSQRGITMRELQEYIYNPRQLWRQPNSMPTDDFEKTPSSQYFLLQMGKEYYLVDTQGHNYARYVLRLGKVDLAEELEGPVREERAKDVDFKEVPKKKSEPNIIDAVVATLKGKRSERFTKLARRYKKAKRIAETMERLRKDIRDEVQAEADEIFDAKDKVYSRIIDTASLAFMLSKETSDSEVEKFDQAGYIKKLEELTELQAEALEKLKQDFTSMVPKKGTPSKMLEPKEKDPKDAMKEKPPKKLDESKFTEKLDGWLSKWDKHFNKLKSDIEAEL